MNGRGQPKDSSPTTHRGPPGPPRQDADHRQGAARAGPPDSTSPRRVRPRPRRWPSGSPLWPVRDRPGPVAVYASPLERTAETAKPIARKLGLRVRTERGLLECDFGAVDRRASSPRWPRSPSGPRCSAGPAGSGSPEASRSWRCRPAITSAISRLVQLHPGETIVAVSHADPIKAAVASAAGTHLDLFQRLTVAPCSVSAVAFSPAGPTSSP